MSFELRSHTADVAVAAEADTLAGVFDAVATGLAAATADDPPEHRDTFELALSATDVEGLLYDFLDQLIFERDVRDVLPVSTNSDITTSTDGYELTSTVGCVPLAVVSGREIKAVTYADMRVEQTDNGWSAYVVFDV